MRYCVYVCVSLILSQILRDLWTMSSSFWRPESLHCLLRLNAPWLSGTARGTLSLYVLQIMLRTTSQFPLSSSPNVPSVLHCVHGSISIWVDGRRKTKKEKKKNNGGDIMENVDIVSNGFPSQECFHTYVNLCKPNRNTYLQ